MTGKARKWIRPRLIVLGRGTPEENVLQSCKVAKKISGPGSSKLGCYKKNACSGKCSVASKTS